MIKKKNILVISQFFWPEEFPINNIIKNIDEVNFTILTAKPNYPQGNIFKKYDNTGVVKNFFHRHTVFHLPVIPRKKNSSIFLSLNYISFLFSTIFYGYGLLKNKKIDLVFVYNTSPITQILSGFFYKKIFKVKMVSWVQDLWPQSVFDTNKLKENKFLLSILSFLCNKIYNLNDMLLFQSPYFKKFFLNNFNKKIIFLPNSSNIEFVKKNGTFLKNAKNFINIVYAGNIGNAQEFDNFHIFLNNLYIKNPNIKFHLIGDGSYKSTLLKNLNEHNAKNVEIYPYIKNKYLYNFLKDADIFFLSLKKGQALNLTIPSKFQNYLSCGKPILGWVDGVTKKLIIQANCGIVASPGNIKSLLSASIKICDQNQIKKYGNNSKIFYDKNYNLKFIKQKLLKSFQILYL